jgi:hypothetical protein
MGQFRKVATFSFEHFVGTHKERFWYFEPERLGGFEIDSKFEFCRLLDRQVCWLGSAKQSGQLSRKNVSIKLHQTRPCGRI